MSVLESIDSPVVERDRPSDIVSSLVEETKRNEPRRDRSQRETDDRPLLSGRTHRRRDAGDETEESYHVRDSENSEDRKGREAGDRPRVRERERDRRRSRDIGDGGAAEERFDRVNVVRERPRSPLAHDAPIDRRREGADGVGRQSRRHSEDESADAGLSGAPSRSRREEVDESGRLPLTGRPALPRDADVGSSTAGPPGDLRGDGLPPRPPRISASQELSKAQPAPVLRARDAEVPFSGFMHAVLLCCRSGVAHVCRCHCRILEKFMSSEKLLAVQVSDLAFLASGRLK